MEVLISVGFAIAILVGFVKVLDMIFEQIGKTIGRRRFQKNLEQESAMIQRELSNQLTSFYYKEALEKTKKYPLFNILAQDPKRWITHAEYEEYLRSPEWKKKALSRIEIDEYQCQYCGSEVASMRGKKHIPNVHHYHYRTLKNENVHEDLVTLCKHCHLTLHRHYGLHQMEHEIKLVRENKRDAYENYTRELENNL